MTHDTQQDAKPDPGHLALATVLVLLGAFTGIWAASGLIAALALMALMRICWLEDNINNDLYGQDQIPVAYRNTVTWRGNILRRWLGIDPATDLSDHSPHQLATLMRAEVQIWACVLLGLTATLTAQFGPFGWGGNLVIAAAIFVVACRRIDKLVVSLAHCAAGRALPREKLLPARQWSQSDKDGR